MPRPSPAPPPDGPPSRPPRPSRPPEAVFSGGTYGLVLASTLTAALTDESEQADPGSDLLWLFLAVLTTAAAHGYARSIADRAAGRTGGAARTLRAMAAEWPLVAAAVPATAMLLAAVAGWWAESTAADAALLVNAAALFAAGAWAARLAGCGRRRAALWGCADMALGVVVIIADAALG